MQTDVLAMFLATIADLEREVQKEKQRALLVFTAAVAAVGGELRIPERLWMTVPDGFSLVREDDRMSGDVVFSLIPAAERCAV